MVRSFGDAVASANSLGFASGYNVDGSCGSVSFYFDTGEDATEFIESVKALDPDEKRQKVLWTLRNDIMMAGKVQARKVLLEGVAPDEPDSIEYLVRWVFDDPNDVDDFYSSLRYMMRIWKK